MEGSLEYYDGKVGFFSLGVFYKKLNSFISSTTTVEPYSTTGYPLSFLLPGQTGSILYNVTQPVNVNGADIKGVEAAAQHDFDFLPAPLDHFGIAVNGTYADGSAPAIIDSVSVTLPLVNLSKWTANATLYYETSRWGARISQPIVDPISIAPARTATSARAMKQPTTSTSRLTTILPKTSRPPWKASTSPISTSSNSPICRPTVSKSTPRAAAPFCGA